jgi:hypothetical protein
VIAPLAISGLTRARIGPVALFALAFAMGAEAQVVVVQRNVNVRPTASSEQEPLAKLVPPEEADLLDLPAEGGYLPVRTGAGIEGWVWSRNVRIDSTRHSVVLGIPVYDRREWRHWITRYCRDTRQQVLIRDAIGSVEFETPNECRVRAGAWVDPFSGDTLREVSRIDIDHMVPLKAAHESGGWRWDPEKKERFANDLTDLLHLLAVSASLNRSKGDRGPDRWMPPDTAFWCQYGLAWERIKTTWNLSMSAEEVAAVDDAKRRCR